MKILAVASEKANKTTRKWPRGGKLRKMLPKPKLKIHPSQLSTLVTLRYSISVEKEWSI
jgi:hypothetical protein